jgi:hypothetical protein
MAARKTVKIADVLDTGNRMLALSSDDMTREREAIASLLDAILMSANAYRGYTYLASEKNAETGELLPTYDDTRRRYYIVH